MAFDNAGNLFVSAVISGEVDDVIYKITSGGIRSTFALGSFGPSAPMACDSAGNLFVSDGGNILKFTPSGVRSTFASGVNGSLAFGPPTPKPPDFNNDGRPDYLLYNASMRADGFVVYEQQCPHRWRVRADTSGRLATGECGGL